MFSLRKRSGRTDQATAPDGQHFTPRQLSLVARRLRKLYWRFRRLSQKAKRREISGISLEGVDGAILQLQAADVVARDALAQAVRSAKGGDV